jgi:RNA polymerase sigma-70 factor (ECF subfamily)
VSDEDRAAMLAAQAGDGDAFARVVDRYAERLFRYLRVVGCVAADADDLVQETFMRAWRYRERFDPRYAVSTWLFTIAQRLAASHRHRRGRAAQPLGETDPAAAEPPPDGDPLADGLWAKARAELAERDFRALWLRYAEDLEVSEIAEVLGISAGNAKVVLHRARARLAERLSQLAPVKEG